MSNKVIVSLDIGTSNLCALALSPRPLQQGRGSCDSLPATGGVAICSQSQGGHLSVENDTEIANLAAGYHEQDPLLIRDVCQFEKAC